MVPWVTRNYLIHGLVRGTRVGDHWSKGCTTLIISMGGLPLNLKCDRGIQTLPPRQWLHQLSLFSKIFYPFVPSVRFHSQTFSRGHLELYGSLQRKFLYGSPSRDRHFRNLQYNGSCMYSSVSGDLATTHNQPH
ncbi:hypothetical protein TNCV_2989891 [Trichonephila clavipes]|nr:hypothetical protein TNCV_2989891 [Trichonephila clavipes]